MDTELVKSENALEMKRVFAAPVALVYRAWTDPKVMNRWFHPGAEMVSLCSVDLQVEGRYEVRMQHPEGATYVVVGVYKQIVPEERLVFTWQWQAEEETEETLVTVTFRTVGANQTELTLLHERFGSEEERDGHAQGWEGTLEQLAAAVA